MYINERDHQELLEAAREGAREHDRSVALVRRFETALRSAVNEHCTCGGGSPDDGCPACKVWHGVMTR